MVLDRQASADSSALTTTNPQPIVVADADRFDLASAINQSEIADWSNSATELIDTTPLPWTRGLLYFLLVFIAILLPWACLYKMDEIGTARGRLEFKGNTIKREADVDGSVAVVTAVCG
jgi:hemolysin D